MFQIVQSHRKPLLSSNLTFSPLPVRRFSIWKHLRKWLLSPWLLIALVSSTAAAATPNFVGPYTYSSWSLTSKKFPSEQAMVDWYKATYMAAHVDTHCDMTVVPRSEWDGNSRVYGGTVFLKPECKESPPSNFFQVDRSRLECYDPQRHDNGACVDVQLSPPRGTPGDNGPGCCDGTPQPPPLIIPNPINPATGNMWHEELDYVTATDGGLVLKRTYNSNMSRTAGFRGFGFGYSWSTKFDARIEARPGFSAEKPTAVCYRRTDTGAVFCEAPVFVNPSDPLKAVAVIRGDGKELLFVQPAPNLWTPAFGGADKLSATYATDGVTIVGWTFSTAVGGTEQFDGKGLLLSITALNGRMLTMTYSDGATNDTSIARYPATAPSCTNVQPDRLLPAGLLLCATDDSGRRLQFEYDSANRIAKVLDPAGGEYRYEYDGLSGGCTTGTGANARACKANNLTAVTYPNLGKKTYHYNEQAQVASCFQSVGAGFGHLTNSLTGISDENGARHLYWRYDCAGRASGSKLAENATAFEIVYGGLSATGDSENTVRRYFGDKALNQFQSIIARNKFVAGVSKNVSVSTPCPECGQFASRIHDANGNVKSGTDWAGNQTTYTYDPVTRLETSRVEGFGSPIARTITTEWDLTVRLPSAVAEPKRITRTTYNTLGKVLTRTVQATTDQNGTQGMAATLTGSPRKTTYTYTPRGQLESVDGPRTDVTDVISYTYDPASGALATVTNALGHATVFSEFDIHGRPGKVSARGVTTTLDYTSRGWLKSALVTAGGNSQSTLYDYDLAGLVTTITQPDGTSLTMKYDDAHRLIKVSDSAGNSVEYDLDVLGVRIAERYKDPTGALARQISRSLDVNAAIFKVTGAAQ
jgi:YD repeat-containing protein